MKVSFTGNYLYTFKDRKTCDKALDAMNGKRADMVSPDFIVEKMDENQMLLLNGQDYQDYKNMLKLNTSVDIKGFCARQAALRSYSHKAQEIDLSDILFNPKYV